MKGGCQTTMCHMYLNFDRKVYILQGFINWSRPALSHSP
uniref:Uncharacterized protein n=1 Tax=Anguilla anguilla TaxID=7936 RepID=A0A0E9QC75_ANGAN